MVTIHSNKQILSIKKGCNNIILLQPNHHHRYYPHNINLRLLALRPYISISLPIVFVCTRKTILPKLKYVKRFLSILHIFFLHFASLCTFFITKHIFAVPFYHTTTSPSTTPNTNSSTLSIPAFPAVPSVISLTILPSSLILTTNSTTTLSE